MFKKLILVLAFVGMIVPAYAGRTTLENGRGQEVGQVLKPHAFEALLGSSIVKSTSGTLYLVTLSGQVAGSGASIYDATSKTGYPVMEIEVGVANSTQTISIPGGISFSNGIYVDVNADFTDYTGVRGSDGLTLVYD